MNSLAKLLIGTGLLFGTLFAPSAIYSQKQDILEVQTQQPKKEKKYYYGLDFSIAYNLNKNINEMIGILYGCHVEAGRRIGEEIKLGLIGEYYEKSKKQNNEKNKQKIASIGLGGSWSPFAIKNSRGGMIDPLYFGVGFKLYIDDFEFYDKANSYIQTNEIKLINPGFSIRVGGEIGLGKKEPMKLNLGVEYNYSRTKYEEEPVDLSTFGCFVGIRLN
jgi:hypothetical protein